MNPLAISKVIQPLRAKPRNFTPENKNNYGKQKLVCSANHEPVRQFSQRREHLA
jgi:hypothetical protein